MRINLLTLLVLLALLTFASTLYPTQGKISVLEAENGTEITNTTAGNDTEHESHVEDVAEHTGNDEHDDHDEHEEHDDHAEHDEHDGHAECEHDADYEYDLENGAEVEEGGHEGHDHGTAPAAPVAVPGQAKPWEWSGVFEITPGEKYTFVAMQNNGSYAAATMKVLIIPVASASREALLGAKTQAEELWKNVKLRRVTAKENRTILSGAAYNMRFDSTSFASLFQIGFNDVGKKGRAEGTSAYAMYLQHNPGELKGSVPYLMSKSGKELKPVAVDPMPTVEPKTSVGVAVGAAFCVAIASFIGILLLVPGFAWLAGCFSLLNAIDAFASGALLALILFIVIPEAILSIAVQYPIETQTSAWFGSLLLAGFVTPILIDWFTSLLFPGVSHGHGHGPVDVTAKKGSTDTMSSSISDGQQPVENRMAFESSLQAFDPEAPPDYFYPTPVGTPSHDAPPDSERDVNETLPYKEAGKRSKVPRVFRDFFKCCPLNAVVWSITIGDGLHNFADGVLLGIAFKFCGASTGWTIAGTSIVHELASELSEFWLLINPEAGGLSWLQALVINFITSLTVVMGCLMVYYINFTAFSLGLILAFAAGVLLFIATVSIWARLLEREATISHIILMFCSFAFGAVAIGLVLFSHNHCEISEDHAGHNH